MTQKRPASSVIIANPPPDAPKVALILAAEVIFARDGIDSASLREIAALAGQRNHHAVQYHFGSRDALIQAVFDYRMEQMEAGRGTMLDAAQAEGKLGDLRTIVNIIFMPQIELIDAYGDHSYAAFLSAYLLRYLASLAGAAQRPISSARWACCASALAPCPKPWRSGGWSPSASCSSIFW